MSAESKLREAICLSGASLFNRGLTHFLVFTAEAYVYSVSAVFNANMVAFMKADLAAVDRKRTPWVVALVHKDWTMQANAYADFNNVLESGGVDLLFCGHVHYCKILIRGAHHVFVAFSKALTYHPHPRPPPFADNR